MNIEKHPHFDLWLHSTEALEKEIGQGIEERKTIHDWPLSSVQVLRLSDASKMIYKTQHLATVEPEFYEVAESELLPKHRYLGKVGICEAMLFEFIEGTRVADKDLDEFELLSLGTEVQNAIDDIQGELPVYTDIRNTERWEEFVKDTLMKLGNLITSSVFPNIPVKMVDELREWAKTAKIQELISETSCFCHGDPNGDNVFLSNSGLKVIDWQRPRFAPRDIDTAALLWGKGYNMYKHVAKEVAQVFWFLRINWFTLCKSELFPAGRSYESQTMKCMESLFENEECPAQ